MLLTSPKHGAFEPGLSQQRTEVLVLQNQSSKGGKQIVLVVDEVCWHMVVLLAEKWEIISPLSSVITNTPSRILNPSPVTARYCISGVMDAFWLTIFEQSVTNMIGKFTNRFASQTVSHNIWKKLVGYAFLSVSENLQHCHQAPHRQIAVSI